MTVGFGENEHVNTLFTKCILPFSFLILNYRDGIGPVIYLIHGILGLNFSTMRKITLGTICVKLFVTLAN